MGRFTGLSISGGKVFDTLEQGNLAALSGHGVSVGDLLLSADAIKSGLLALPFMEAVATGDGYYLVWPENSAVKTNVEILLNWLTRHSPLFVEGSLVYFHTDKNTIS